MHITVPLFPNQTKKPRGNNQQANNELKPLYDGPVPISEVKYNDLQTLKQFLIAKAFL